MQKIRTQATILRALVPLALIEPSTATFLLGIGVILFIKAELEL